MRLQDPLPRRAIIVAAMAAMAAEAVEAVEAVEAAEAAMAAAGVQGLPRRVQGPGSREGPL